MNSRVLRGYLFHHGFLLTANHCYSHKNKCKISIHIIRVKIDKYGTGRQSDFEIEHQKPQVQIYLSTS